jgi:quercetin dioxygenase-like cupin family protein
MADARIVRGSEGEVYEPTWVFKHGSRTGGAFDFMVGHIGYLTGPPLHVHCEQHDTFLVLDGVLALQIGDDLYDLEPGDFATVPPGVAHTFDNIRDSQPPVKVCNVMTPGGLDELFVLLNEVGATAHDANEPDPEKLAEAGERCGVTFVGPTIGQRLGLA